MDVLAGSSSLNISYQLEYMYGLRNKKLANKALIKKMAFFCCFFFGGEGDIKLSPREYSIIFDNM